MKLTYPKLLKIHPRLYRTMSQTSIVWSMTKKMKSKCFVYLDQFSRQNKKYPSQNPLNKFLNNCVNFTENHWILFVQSIWKRSVQVAPYSGNIVAIASKVWIKSVKFNNNIALQLQELYNKNKYYLILFRKYQNKLTAVKQKMTY